MSATVRAVTALLTLGVAIAPAAAQQAPPRPDSAGARTAYESLSDLLAALPSVAPPPFAEEQALWVGSLPLSCLDRMQPRELRRPGGGSRGNARRAGGARADSATGPGMPASSGVERGASGAARDSASAHGSRPQRERGAHTAAGDSTAEPDRAGRTTADSSASRGSAGSRSAGARNGADYLWIPTYRVVPDYNRKRAFWGCTDWHSAVGSTWATVRLLRRFEGIGLRDLAREKLNDHLGESNLKGELAFFRTAAGDFELPEGYGWLLKLQAELVSWPDSQAERWAANTAPLASWMVDSLTAYLEDLKRPERDGTEANTAFTIDLALDFADAVHDDTLRHALITDARRFYLGASACEPRSEADSATGGGGGSGGAARVRRRRNRDVVSPCLAEAALMARALPPAAFRTWLGSFLPHLTSEEAAPLREVLGDSTQGAERARLTALSFQRAQAMARIASALPPSDSSVAVWRRLSAIQADRGFRILRDDVDGSDRIPAYTLLYLSARAGPVPEDWRGSEPVAEGSVPEPPAAPDSARDSLPAFANLTSFYASLPDVQPVRLDSANALWLSAMPLSCEDHPHDHRDRPPYLWDVTYDPVPDFQDTRAFYGCSDWHSAVNSTWTLVKLLKLRPDLPTAPVIRRKLDEHLGRSNVLGDLAFFKTAGSFELPYGYAWLLRLEGELKSWDDPDARRWAANLEPLASWMAARLAEYLDGLKEPIRVGVHPMTAMAMDNSLAYAQAYDPTLEEAIRENAKRFFAADTLCDTGSEPGPSDFASPCLMEATVMGRLMERSAWLEWVDRFLPPIQSKAFRPLTEPLGPDFIDNPKAIAARSHIIGLAFMRAKGMGELANLLPADDPRVPVLRRLAAIQVEKGFQVIGAVGYAGSHYYATFATLYLLTTG